MAEPEPLGTQDRSQEEKAQALKKIQRELESEDNFSEVVLISEAKAEGISSEFAREWFRREKRKGRISI